MSLINDALKRARSAQKRDVPPVTDGQAIQPVPEPAEEKKRSVLVLPLALVVLGLAGWFLWQWWTTGSKTVVVTQKTTIAATLTNAVNQMVKTVTNVAHLNRSAEAVVDTLIKPTNVVSTPAKSANTTVAAAQLPVANATSNSPVAAAVPSSSNAVVAVSTATRPDIKSDAATAPAANRNVSFTEMKLQAIFFRISKPSALINNKTVYLGDEIGGAKVVKIERQSVKLELGGKFKELFLK
jgi:hypothetical protein